MVGLGAFVTTLVVFRRFRILSDYKYLIGLVGVGLLLITVVFGREVNGARLWVYVGSIGFQLPELAKILLMIFFADTCATYVSCWP